MTLDDYFRGQQIVRNAIFKKTMFPSSMEPFSLCYATNEASIKEINNNLNISAVITTSSLSDLIGETKGVVVSSYPQQTYYELHNKLVDENKMVLIESPYFSPNASIASSAIIGDHVIIEDEVEISEFAYIADNTIIGKGTFIGPYAVLGTRGMQNIKVNGKPYKIKFSGGVKIGNFCEVLAQAVIQKPYQSFFTEIGNYSKVSVRSNIGHGCKIGANSMIAGNATVAGNVHTGNDIWIGPSSVIKDGITLGEKCKVMIGSVVVSNVLDNQIISGNFAIEHSKHLKNTARIKKL